MRMNRNAAKLTKRQFTFVISICFALALSMFGIATLAPSAISGLDKVTGVKVVDRDDDEIEVKWSKVAGAEAYQVTANGKVRGTTSKTSFELENLKSATKYNVTVTALANTGGQRISGPASDTLKTFTEPKEVKNLRSTKKAKTSISLKWNKVTRASKYQVYMYSSSKDKYVKKTTVSKNSAKITGLKKGTSYKFKVRAVTSSSLGTVKGDFSDAKKFTTAGKAKKSSSKYIGKSAALSIALKNAGLSKSQVHDIDVDRDREHGVVVYEVDFDYGSTEYSYEINAKTGKILHKEVDHD